MQYLRHTFNKKISIVYLEFKFNWESCISSGNSRPVKNQGPQDFPGGSVVKNPPANAGDTGSSPRPGRSHMPWSNKAHAPQLRSPCATATEAHAPRACALQQEKPPQWEARAPQRRVAPARYN